jgi:hypothetical protein
MSDDAGTKPPGKLVTAWRVAQKHDADAWSKVRAAPSMRLTRWLGAFAVLATTWGLSGTPRSAVAWLPPLAIAALLILPDAESLGFGSFTWKARQEADRAEAASEKAERIALTVNVGREVGEAEGEAGRVRGMPQPTRCGKIRPDN